MKRHLSILASALLLAAPLPGRAQITVFDPSNFVQNSLTAARTLMEVNNQLVQLQNEAKMLLNDALNLTSLPFDIVNQLRATLATTTALIQQAQGIAFELTQARAQFKASYPQIYAPGTTGAALLADNQQRWLNSLQALQTTIDMQAQAAENLGSDETFLADLVARSQAAVGALQAMQATNQLLALQSRQAIQDQQLRLTQDRAVALEQARGVAEEARARVVRERFMGNGVRYTPQAVGGFGL
jgi:P-type conjugative transfer protein TrbJ